MGRISITVSGSFVSPKDPVTQIFSAEDYGHAFAIGEAVEWLLKRLPDAIANDHDFHQEGLAPACGWPKRGV